MKELSVGRSLLGSIFAGYMPLASEPLSLYRLRPETVMNAGASLRWVGTWCLFFYIVSKFFKQGIKRSVIIQLP